MITAYLVSVKATPCRARALSSLFLKFSCSVSITAKTVNRQSSLYSGCCLLGRSLGCCHLGRSLGITTTDCYSGDAVSWFFLRALAELSLKSKRKCRKPRPPWQEPLLKKCSPRYIYYLVCMTLLSLCSLFLAATSGNPNYLCHCISGRGNSVP